MYLITPAGIMATVGAKAGIDNAFLKCLKARRLRTISGLEVITASANPLKVP